MRLYVIGGPGSGKTTLANALARRTGVAAIHLDGHWDEGYATDDAGRPTAAALTFREELAPSILARSAWIVEGAEPPFLRAVADAAEHIVWCDVSFAVAAARIVRRHVVADLTHANAFPGYGRLWRFLGSVRRHYYASVDPNAPEWTKWTRAYVAHAIEPYRAKVVRSRGGGSTAEVERVAAALSL